MAESSHFPKTTVTNDNLAYQSAYNDNYYGEPKLTAEITDHKLQEVYEEKGFTDKAYDHSESNYSDHDDHKELYPVSSTRHIKQPEFINDAESTKLLKYVSTQMYDKDAHQNGIYAARSSFYCPPMVSFKMEQEGVVGNNNRHKNGQRLSGLGSRITCMKNKYFGRNPLPSTIFLNTGKSKTSEIRMPSFDDFYKDFRRQMSDLNAGFKFR